jgi:DNA-binding transcriptional LysR family regulator
MAPELRHLRHFVAVAEELNFTRAAGRLFLAQQALSASIRQLEQELGEALFVRDTRRVALTPAGETLLPRARRLLGMAEETVAAVRAGEPTRPVLRVDISSSNLQTGALVLRRLREEHRDIEVRQRELGVPRGLDGLRAGELDLLLGNALRAPAEVNTELLRLERVQVMLAADHPAAAAAAVPIGTLAEQEWLLPADDAAPEWNDLVLDLCQRAGFRPRRYPGTTWGPTAAAELAVERRCVVPTNAWVSAPPGVVFRPLVEPVGYHPWSAMWLGEPTGPVAAFLAAARALAPECDWLRRDGDE